MSENHNPETTPNNPADTPEPRAATDPAATEDGRREPPVVATVRGLQVALTRRTASGQIGIVEDVHLSVAPGEVVGLVGESGSGKTTMGTAFLGYARRGAWIAGGDVEVNGHLIHSADPNVPALSADEVRALRGVQVGYVPQDPSSALNPAIRIGDQLLELLDMHSIGAPAERQTAIRDILPEVGLPNDEAFLRRYPHQLSGGQVQRVALAMVFLPRPKMLVLDEPTTGLDVTTQGMVLDTLLQLCRRWDVAALYVTHDLAVVSAIADRVAVMYAGQVVEQGPAKEIFNNPVHPYSRALLRAIPHLNRPFALEGIEGQTPPPGSRPGGCRFHDRCRFAIDECRTVEPPREEVTPGHWSRCLRVDELPPWNPMDRLTHDTDPEAERNVLLEVSDLNVYYGKAHVVHNVGFDVAEREVVALVGESGSGKTTISRCIGGLHDQWDGRISYRGEEMAAGARRRTAVQRRRVQYVFQNPYGSLNPHRTVGQILSRPLELFDIASGKDVRGKVAELLDSVQLRESTMDLRTSALSGGERQRVAIARALAAEPDVLVCDEITSALDVSIQASIVQLLTDIKHERGIGMVFVTHDLPLVRTIADRVLVLQHGRVVEQGLTAEVFDNPQEDYTRLLIDNTPTFEQTG